MWQTKLDVSSTGKVVASGGTIRNLPEPLQCCEFEPKSDPKFFAYGGENISLSVNNIQQFFADTDEEPEDNHDGGHHTTNGVGHQDEQENGEGPSEEAESSTTRKRRRTAERRAKAKELMKGEIWRAKNVSKSRSSYKYMLTKICLPASRRQAHAGGEGVDRQHCFPDRYKARCGNKSGTIEDVRSWNTTQGCQGSCFVLSKDRSSQASYQES